MLNKLVIISGLSGSGKSSALNAFEDLDFYSVDNLPIKLFEKFLEIVDAGSGEFSKVAMVMDLRDRDFADTYPTVFRKIMQRYKHVDIVFLDAQDEVLTRRFSETRRKHPLSSQSVAEGIAAERKIMGDLKDMATVLIDTTAMDVHSLKKRIVEQYGAQGAQRMQIRLLSFGFKYGTPKNADLLLDVRFLSNPHFVTELRDSTGLDKNVTHYIQGDPAFPEFIERTEEYLRFLIPHYAKEGKSYLTIGVGCTGGKHRSVYIAEEIAERLKTRLDGTFTISVEHQDLRLTR